MAFARARRVLLVHDYTLFPGSDKDFFDAEVSHHMVVTCYRVLSDLPTT
jgi:hypothetical protein